MESSLPRKSGARARDADSIVVRVSDDCNRFFGKAEKAPLFQVLVLKLYIE
jgi:hypothetical protein